MYIYCCPKCHTTIVHKSDDGGPFSRLVKAHKKYHNSSMSFEVATHMSSEATNMITWGLQTA